MSFAHAPAPRQTPPKLVIFDCDGVLIDSEPQSALAIRAALAEAGREMDLAAIHQAFSGDGAAAFRAKLTAMGLEAETVAAATQRHLYALFETEVLPMPGMAALLAELPVPACVASNSGIERLRQSLQRLPMARVFGHHIYSAEHVARAKPAPDLAQHCLAQTGIAAEHAVFIDDNPHGILCARACGIRAIGFVQPAEAGDTRRIDALREAGAQAIAVGVAELRPLLLAGQPALAA